MPGVAMTTAPHPIHLVRQQGCVKKELPGPVRTFWTATDDEPDEGHCLRNAVFDRQHAKVLDYLIQLDISMVFTSKVPR